MSKRLRREFDRYTAVREVGTGRGWVFLSRHGDRLTDISEQVRTAYRAAGLEPQGCHILRRTWATRLLRGGADIELVRKLGGWSSLEVMRSYLSSDDAAAREAIELG